MSLPQLAVGLLADTITIGLDARGAGYDKLSRFIKSRRVLPETPIGRLALIAAVLVGSQLIKQRLGNDPGLLLGFVAEISHDGVREQVKRMLEEAELPAEQMMMANSLLQIPGQKKHSGPFDYIAGEFFPWLNKN